MQSLLVTSDMKGRVYVDCPDDSGWIKTSFDVDPVDLQTHVYGLLCPRCGQGLVWDGRQIHEDMVAISRRLKEMDE